MAARAYRAYGLVFSSVLAFPELSTTRGSRPAIRLITPRTRLDADGWSDESARPGPDGRPWLFVSRRNRDYRLRFDQADFVLRGDGRTIAAYPRARTSVAAMRHLALNQVLPLALGHRGWTVLHAGAFAADGCGVALLGSTGAGKSTLVASFAAHGCPMMSDDAVVLRKRGGRLLLMPAHHDVRVRPDSYATFVRMKPVPFHARPVPLGAMYLLATGPDESAIRIERLTARETLIELIKSSYMVDVTDQNRLIAQLDRLMRECLPFGVRRISYPRRFDTLPRVRDAILNDLR